jgi:hypothetical protein
MNELLNDDKSTTADLVNRRLPAAAVAPNPATSEAAASVPPDGGVDSRNPQLVSAVNQPTQLNPLFREDELQSFRSRWGTVQTSFVDEPRAAVEQADSLVANVVKRIAEQFTSEREQLEKQWDRGENVDTEDLRQALKRYRAFFDRLLAF